MENQLHKYLCIKLGINSRSKTRTKKNCPKRTVLSIMVKLNLFFELGVFVLEFVNSTSGIHQFSFPSVERV